MSITLKAIIAKLAPLALILLFCLPALAGEGTAEKPWYSGFAPILILLVVVAIVWMRLPKVKDLAHLEDQAFRLRRGLNWLPLGLAYAFLYWGRYNLQVAIQALESKTMISDFNWIFGVGTAVYGVSFLINGPLTDRKGGRFAILAGTIGATCANLLMGLMFWLFLNNQTTAETLFWSMIILYPINMYFQSFGAVAIVKVNAAWFHVNERGTFGAIFGILISLGIYFAFDWSYAIVAFAPAHWAFFAPAIALAVALCVCYFVVQNTPVDANLANIRTDDATEGDLSPRLPAWEVFKKMFSNKIVLTVALIEFCSGFLRQAIMQLYRFFAKATDGTLHLKSDFVYENWGLLLCCAGIMGGVFAGFLSDHVFGAKRGPVAAVLYTGMLCGSVAMCFLLGSPGLGWLVIFMSLCVIGVHGMLSGVASQDFGGTKNVGIAVGIIDGFVYAGTAAQAILYANILPKGDPVAAAVVSNWSNWPIAMVPLAFIGLVLAYKIRYAKPKPKASS